MEIKIYLNVPYKEKENAKSLGAHWDSSIKKWYFEGNIKDIPKLGKWIAENRSETIILYEDFCIIEALRVCYRCGKQTRVIGFGIRDHIVLYDNDNEHYSITGPEYFPQMEDDINLAWSSEESNIPPLILSYIKDKYNVKTGTSSIVGSCFANHCDYCNIIQGNNYLFNEDSPLRTSTNVEKELITRMNNLKIYNIYIDSAIVVDWDIAYCSNDWAYNTYCKHFEDLILPNTKDMFISYSELYCLN